MKFSNSIPSLKIQIVSFLCFLFSATVFSQVLYQDPVKMEIAEVLNVQKEAWNNYDIATFMETYWKSEELKFYGSAGVVKGWQATLERYQKSYPTEEHFGSLDFVINDISEINEDAYYVLGEYYLTRTVGDTNGIFMLVVKRFEDGWKTVADTSAKIE